VTGRGELLSLHLTVSRHEMRSTQQGFVAIDELRPNIDAKRAGPVYFLLHVPKTAGQTIQVHLADHCAPGVFWQSRRRFRPGRRTSVADFPDLSRVRVICGHHISRSLEQFFPGRDIRRVVLLRDPLQLQLSFYNWTMMDHLAKGLGTYSFALHLQALPRNFISHFLLSRWLEIPQSSLMVMSDRWKYEILNRALSGFWFVGAHTDCARVAAEIGSDLGLPPISATRNTSAEMQAHTGWQLVTRESLSRSMQDAIRARNPLDQALWESWAGAGFEAATNRTVALRPNRNTFRAREIIRPWFRFRRFLCRNCAERRRPIAVVVDRANSARDAGEWEAAARHYRESLTTLPKAPAIWVQYGHALKESGFVAEAERAYRRSLELDPDTADTYLQLGHALKLQGRIGEAESAYLRAAALDPAQDHARNELIALGWSTRRIAREMRISEPEIILPGGSDPG
jgi:tetratricopeptide (TPR) repeat protein